MVAMLVITDKVVRPVLAGAGKPRPGRPRKLNAVDIHYKNLRREMHNLFDTLRIAA
jgi:hypothetical protein